MAMFVQGERKLEQDWPALLLRTLDLSQLVCVRVRIWGMC